MRKVTLRGIRAHKLRFVLTSLAVVIGVAFVSGSLIFSDTLANAIDNVFASTIGKVDLTISQTDSGSSSGSSYDTSRVPTGVLDQVRGVDGVAAADGIAEGSVHLLGSDGKALGNGFSATQAFNWPSNPVLTPFKLSKGRAPQSDQDIAIDEPTAIKNNLQVGDSLFVAADNGPQKYRVSGLLVLPPGAGAFNISFAALSTPTAQKLFADNDSFNDIVVAAKSGVSADDLKRRIDPVLPPGVTSVTTAATVQKQKDSVQSGVNVLTSVMLGFAGVALFVCAFIILNTFSILVAQRTRELALLRALGARRGQVMRSVLTEAAVVGLVASLVGALMGVAACYGLIALLGHIGFSIGNVSIQLQPRSFLVGIAVGLVLTVVAAFLPARRATRIAPVAALREATPKPRRIPRKRLVFGLPALVFGLLLLVTGLGGGDNALTKVASGSGLIFLSVPLLAPWLATPVIRLLAVPVAAFSVSGRLARGNALRQPLRTASSASALTIGLSLITFFAVLAATLKDSTIGLWEHTIRADYVVSVANGVGYNGVPQQAIDQISHDKKTVGAVSSVTDSGVDISNPDGSSPAGKNPRISLVEPQSFAALTNLDITQGDFSKLQQGGLAISTTVADNDQYRIGDTLAVGNSGKLKPTIVAVYRPNGVLQDYTISRSVYTQFGQTASAPDYTFVQAAPGVSRDQLKKSLDGVVRAVPGLAVQTPKEVSDQVGGVFDSLFSIVYALLALAVLVAVLGIVNTLVLSVVERTREIGLLRAVGMMRSQVRSMVRWEAVFISLFGGVLGLAVGIGFGYALYQPLSKLGISVFSIPVVQLLIFVGGAALAGLVGALIPARSVARIDVLRAITVE